MARLKEAHALKATAYSSADASHERLLRRLWNCGFPGVEMSERVTEQWLRIGFQGADPATDFRGMGVLGLQNLVYFGEHYPEVFQRLVSKQRKRDYPLACAGINVTAMLVDLLRLLQSRPVRLPALLHAAPCPSALLVLLRSRALDLLDLLRVPSSRAAAAAARRPYAPPSAPGMLSHASPWPAPFLTNVAIVSLLSALLIVTPVPPAANLKYPVEFLKIE